MSARVYRSYLRKLHQQNEKSAIKNQQLEKASLELTDHTRKIATDFCNWVEGIGGEDPSCNISKDDVMDWFAVGIDAMEVEADKSCNDAKDKLIKDAPYSCNCHESQRRRKSREQNQKSQYEASEWIIADDELTELEYQNQELESKLKSLPSTNLLKEYKYKRDTTK